MGIGADGDDFAAQLPEAPEVIRRGQKAAAAVYTAGVHFQSFSLGSQNSQDFVNDFPVLLIWHRAGSGVSGGLADVSQMGQNVKVLMNLDTGQGFFQIPPLCLPDGFAFPESGKINIQIVHKVDGTQHKIKGPPLQILRKLILILFGQAKLHTPADFQARNFQIVILFVILCGIEGHGGDFSQRVIVHMVGKTDFLQSRGSGSQGHFFSGVVPVKGYPRVHMKVKHSLSPPRIGGTP